LDENGIFNQRSYEVNKRIWIAALLLACSAAYAARPFPGFDADKDGKLSKEEFLAWKKAGVTEAGHKYVEAAQLKVFEFFDEDKDGFVSQADLKSKKWTPSKKN
jgi:hypothetical protein